MVKHRPIYVDPTNFINLGEIAFKLLLLCYFSLWGLKGCEKINTNDNNKHPGYVWISIL